MLIIYSEFKKINSKYKYCTYSKEVIPLYVQKFVGELRLCFSKETKIIISLKLNYIITARICRKKTGKKQKRIKGSARNNILILNMTLFRWRPGVRDDVEMETFSQSSRY